MMNKLEIAIDVILINFWNGCKKDLRILTLQGKSNDVLIWNDANDSDKVFVDDLCVTKAIINAQS